MNKFLFTTILLIGCLVSCKKNNETIDTPNISGTVEKFDSYGMLVTSFTPQDMIEAGFEYTDLLDVEIGSNLKLTAIPFLTSFNEVGILELVYCDYNATGTMYGFGQLNGNFEERIGGKIGDSVKITLNQHLGYADTYKLMRSIYDTDYSKYGSDEVFANFREVTTTGMLPKTLYRSSNPLNPNGNAVRYAYADRLAEQAGIVTEIDLADSDEDIQSYIKMDGYESTYCPTLFENGSVIALSLTADCFGETFKAKLGYGLRFMAEHNPPYLVHCNEGKDRCGFVSMLLEAFAGATYDQLASDYMTTITNFYGIAAGTYDYSFRQWKSIDRMIWLLENEDVVTDYANIDWDAIDPVNVKWQEAARNYIKECGLSDAECDLLYNKLTGN